MRQGKQEWEGRDWVVAEFVRLHHGVSANEAQSIVESLVTRRAPAVQEFQGFLKVLNPKLEAGDHVLLVLYHRCGEGATYAEIDKWVRLSMRTNLKRALNQMSERRAYVHFDGANTTSLEPELGKSKGENSTKCLTSETLRLALPRFCGPLAAALKMILAM